MLRTHLPTRPTNLLATFAVSLAVTASLLGASCSSSIPFSAIGVNAAAPVITKGSTTQMTAIAAHTDGSFTDITSQVQWTSSSKAVADFIDDSGAPGLVVGNAPGTVTISARLNGIIGSKQLQVR